MATPTYRKNEVQFCAEVSKWADRIFERNPGLPFGSSDIESYGTGSHKRQDFRAYERKAGGRGQIALSGEVKLSRNQQYRCAGLALQFPLFLSVSNFALPFFKVCHSESPQARPSVHNEHRTNAHTQGGAECGYRLDNRLKLPSRM